jgi:hypothetical protein
MYELLNESEYAVSEPIECDLRSGKGLSSIVFAAPLRSPPGFLRSILKGGGMTSDFIEPSEQVVASKLLIVDCAAKPL